MKGKIKQIAVVVKDVKEAMKHYWEILAIGPWDVRHFTNETVRNFYYCGEEVKEPFEFICAVCWVGNIEFELIEPVKGPNVYWEFLEKKGEGLHHFKIVIEDDEELKEYVDELAAKGLAIMQTGWIDHDVHYYLDSNEVLGLTLELGNGGKIGAPDYVYPENITEEEKRRRQPDYKQIAVTGDDANKYMQNFWDILGIGPWDVRHFTPETVRDFKIDGKPCKEDFDFICAVCWAGDMELEIIQPIKGPVIYWDHLNKSGTGLHHVKDVMSDKVLPEVIENFAKKGLNVWQTGWIDDDVHYYLNAGKDLKMVLELGNGGKIGAPDDVYPHLNQ